QRPRRLAGFVGADLLRKSNESAQRRGCGWRWSLEFAGVSGWHKSYKQEFLPREADGLWRWWKHRRDTAAIHLRFDRHGESGRHAVPPECVFWLDRRPDDEQQSGVAADEHEQNRPGAVHLPAAAAGDGGVVAGRGECP